MNTIGKIMTSVLIAGSLLLPEDISAASSTIGSATYYCCTVGYSSASYVGAAGPRLRQALGPHWRGRSVTVWYGNKHVRIKLVDSCRCPHGRVIDLHPRPFSKLGALRIGVLRRVRIVE